VKPGLDPYAAALKAMDDWYDVHGDWPTKELIMCARANNALVEAGQRLAETVEILNAAPRTHTTGNVNVTLTHERMVEASAAVGQWNQTILDHKQ